MATVIEMSGDRTFDTANRVASLLVPSARIERRTNGMYVCWTRSNGSMMSRRWQCRGQDFFPVWSHILPCGGTCTTALSQLVRWVQCKPVLPISTWEYWTGPKVRLGRDRGDEIVRMLYEAEYPEVVDCVLCHKEIDGGMDWWSLNGVSGPCCDMNSGCKQIRVGK